MVAEVEVVKHMNNMVGWVFVFLAEVIQNADLDERLVVEPLLIPYDFDCDVLVGLVIQCANHLPETPLPNHLQDLISVRYVVM